ncbi:MAG: hypothetical protein KJ658_00765 [Proteobacteria bacterium]|nr:hypothetical protein [Pseudomonadota bacterium]
MAYKMIEQYLSFADIAIQKHADKNRTLVYLSQFDKTIDWEPVQKALGMIMRVMTLIRHCSTSFYRSCILIRPAPSSIF